MPTQKWNHMKERRNLRRKKLMKPKRISSIGPKNILVSSTTVQLVLALPEIQVSYLLSSHLNQYLLFADICHQSEDSLKLTHFGFANKRSKWLVVEIHQFEIFLHKSKRAKQLSNEWRLRKNYKRYKMRYQFTTLRIFKRVYVNLSISLVLCTIKCCWYKNCLFQQFFNDILWFWSLEFSYLLYRHVNWKVVSMRFYIFSTFLSFFLDGGENARKYFSFDLRPVIVDKLHDATPDQKENITRMLHDNSVIAR